MKKRLISLIIIFTSVIAAYAVELNFFPLTLSSGQTQKVVLLDKTETTLTYVNVRGTKKTIPIATLNQEAIQKLEKRHLPKPMKGDLEVVQFELAMRHLNGKGFRKNEKIAADILTTAARSGDSHAQGYLGLLYEEGVGVPQSYSTAASWYGKASKNGDDLSMVALGRLYDEGKGVEQSYKNALYCFRRAASLKNADAMAWLGVYHYYGKGTQRNRKAGISWLKQSEKLGSKIAPRVIAAIRKNDNIRSGTGKKAASPSKVYAGVGSGHWIKENLNRGAYIILEDNSFWKIDPLDKIYTTLWLEVSEVVVVESTKGTPGYNYLLINKDDDEKVHAKYLGKK